MILKNELGLVLETFKKSRIRASVLKMSELFSVSDVGMHSLLGRKTFGEQLSSMLKGTLTPRTVYKILDVYELHYICFLISEKEDLVLFIGPYLSAPPLRAFLLEIGEKNAVSPKHQRYIEEFYSGLAVLGDNNPLFMMLDSLCEHLWQSPSFSVLDLRESCEVSFAPVIEPSADSPDGNALVSMRAIEQRYEFENEMILAVSLGQIHKEKQLLAAFSEKAFEKRITDYLRNAKNYCVIMNTLLRKAAERGGVHPFYIDRLSSDFAAKIERMNYLNENAPLMREMFRGYCRLVHKHSTSRFSILVEKTIILIESDLSADLSLTYLAKMQNVSAGYLSAVFKKETGKTLSEYVREKRMEFAKYLLETTQLQIQSVALHSGILDVQYFSKIFKGYTGKTPREYRESSFHRGER